MPQLDHIILAVNDVKKSVDFYTGILGLKYEGQSEPFSMIRVTPQFIVQLAPWGTKGGEHLAFSMTPAEFDDVLRRVRDQGIAYGDSFQTVGNMRGPGDGPRGASISTYPPRLMFAICAGVRGW